MAIEFYEGLILASWVMRISIINSERSTDIKKDHMMTNSRAWSKPLLQNRELDISEHKLVNSTKLSDFDLLWLQRSAVQRQSSPKLFGVQHAKG